ncbi:HNH endonuclease signature motif containing protein [Rathayibacter sp. VKM Ac-2927]|uniref:HNH endonuclease n=1 Tax=Rathayibacter sp. VKM Ac-2927 TaxID=2929478 RepID=UPI001FB37BC0|nr:HNH endonuclease signature motif containing protein [Rathayibacter sp. VKM Ac-2927]MCJ1688005.1 HNH endonuclease [Rathayibacter sp. VKM Ac-2927]
MDEISGASSAEEPTGPVAAVGAVLGVAADLGVTSARFLLTRAEAVHLAYRTALTAPEEFARGGGLSRSEASSLVERSIRAQFAVALRLSERAASKVIDRAILLVEELPCTRAAVAEGRLLWESSEVICAIAATLPAASRAAFDERAAGVAPDVTSTQLRRIVARLRDELHEEPFAQRHARARQDRAVWISPEIDGMATLCALLPAPDAMGIGDRLDRIARSLREGGDERTLAQLKADALTDLLCDGDIAGTTPASDGPRVSESYVPGIRAEVRLTLAASTAAGLDDAPADLDGYGLIPADLARALVETGASFTRVLTDPDTRAVVSVGRTYRVPPPQMRLHLQLRDQTCRFPGCTRSASRSEADHTIEWRNGGETSLENLVSLCVSHHHVRHGDRWTYVPRPDGGIVWTTPTGRTVTIRPPALAGAPPGPRFEDVPPPF